MFEAGADAIGRLRYDAGMLTSLLVQKWNAGLDYKTYVASGTAEQQRRWNTFHSAVNLTEPQKHLLASFTRQVNVLTVSGIWCGDCVEQVPFLDHFATAANGKVIHKVLDRDLHKDLSSLLKINSGDRVPVVLFLSEELEFCALAGDRSLSRYRAKAQRDLGDTCPTGLFIPPPEQSAATMQDWLDELERVHLMLRLSPKLRQKHGD